MLSALHYQAFRAPLCSTIPFRSYLSKNLQSSYTLRQQNQHFFKIPGNRFYSSIAKRYAFSTINSHISKSLPSRDIFFINFILKARKFSAFKEFHTHSQKGLYKNSPAFSLTNNTQSFTSKYFKKIIATVPSGASKYSFRHLTSFFKDAQIKPYELALFAALTLSFLTWLVSDKIFCEASVPETPELELLSLEEKQPFDEISESDIPLEGFEDICRWNITVDLIKNHWKLAVLTVVSAILTTLISLKIPIAIGSLVNIISKSLILSSQTGGAVAWDVLNELRAPSLRILFLFIAHASAMASHILLVTYLGEQLGRDLRSRLYQQCLSLDLHRLDSSRSGELTNIINSDVGDFKQTFKQCLTQGVRCVTMLGGTAFHLYSLSPTLSGYLATLIPIFYTCLYVYGKTLRRCRSEARNTESVAAGMAQEVLGAVRTVRAYAAEDWEVSRYDSALSDSTQANMLFGLHMGLFRGGMTLSVGSVILIVLYFGGQLVLQGAMQPGELMTFLVATENAQKALDALGGLLGQTVKAVGTGSRLLDFLAISPSSTMKALHGSGIILPQIRGSITFRDVEFSYSDCETPSISNLDLHVPAGTTLALVGASGAGKSTVASLLERFYELKRGVILLDGVPLHLLDPKWLRGEVIGFLSQEPTLFAGTIAENICYGSKIDPFKGRAAIQSAAEAAHIHQFIETLPKGYDTVIGERGASLSGGQKQRVAIARALLKDPKILILDEATSALDGRAEAAVQAALQTLMANRTTIVIAHRLSTIQGAHQIVVMGPPGDSGSIIEKGSHQELLMKKGAYYSLFQKALPS